LPAMLGLLHQSGRRDGDSAARFSAFQHRRVQLAEQAGGQTP
jgi:hypothetical protein